MLPVSINLWTFWNAAMIYAIIGVLWYSPLFFGGKWLPPAGARARSPLNYVALLAAAVVAAFVMAFVVDAAGVSSAGQGAQIGFLVWLGFTALTGLVSVLFEGRPFRPYLISIAGNLLAFIVMGIILAAR